MTEHASPLERHRARLWRFVELPDDQLQPTLVFGAIHDAIAELRAAGPDPLAERYLLLPVVMRLVGHASLDGPTRRNLLAWLEVMDGPAEDGTTRRA